MTRPNSQGCVAYNPAEGRNEYGYAPSLTAGAIFTALFLVSMFVHIVQVLRTRTWWCLVFAIGALTEAIGWGGRTWSARCPLDLTAFLMQISTLIIAPTFFTAGIYIILGRLIHVFGRNTSPISSTMYLWIFCTCDIVSLVVQAIGGTMASAAFSHTPPKDASTGTHCMVAGIIFQLVSITVFVALFINFLRRVNHSHIEHHTISRRIWVLVAASAFSCTMIYIRSIYRTVELLQGWRGYVITHEAYFIGFDAALMLCAVAIFNFVHPVFFMPTRDETSSAHELTQVLKDGGS